MELSAGENVLWVSEMMGHADPHVTLQKYAKYAPDLTRRDGSAFEALLNERLNSNTQEDLEGDEQ